MDPINGRWTASLHPRTSAVVPMTATALTLVLALAAPPLSAQDGGTPTLGPDDYGKWERLGATTLSPDGAWVGAQISRENDEDELRIHLAARPDSVVVIPFGSALTFSSDGAWAAFRIGMSEDEREKLTKQGKQPRNKAGLLELATGARLDVEGIADFAFSGDGSFIALKGYAPTGDREASGVDLIVHDLATGRRTTFGNVSEFGWSDLEALLAFVVDAEGMSGNGVQLYDAAGGRLLTLDSEKTRYERLTWREDSGDLAVLRRVDPDLETEASWADTAHVALAWGALESSTGQVSPRVLSHQTAGFPEGFRVPAFGDFGWDDRGRAIYLGLDEREAACEAPDEGDPSQDAAGDDRDEGEEDEGEVEEGAGGEDGDDPCAEPEADDRPSVEIWHAADVDIVPTQKVRRNMTLRENDLAIWDLVRDRVVPLEDELTEEVRVTDGAAYAVGFDGTPYDDDRMFGPVFRDVYRIDLASGEKTRVLEGIETFFQVNPLSAGGRYVLFVRDDHIWSLDLDELGLVNLTEALPTSFIDLEDDHTVAQKPPHGAGGWLEGDEAVLLYDKHDVWRVAPDGSGGERITDGAESNLRHRRVRLDPDEEAIDPDTPQYFSLYDDWGEMWGYGRADRLGAEVEPGVLEEARVYGLTKAEDAEVYGYRLESFERSPNLFLAGADLGAAAQMTNTNPFQDEYAWGRAELVEFTNAWGDELQGSLYYPAGYEPGRQYPMIVYIYEIRSNAVRSYQVPSETNYYNFQTWIQNGYFVFQPDIVYRDRDPGVSAMATLEPAVQAMVDTGMIDPQGVGLVGHSWGGYQTTFAVTQTDIFSAAVAGAPLTNLFSMYLSVYWNSGGTDARIFEVSQGRMEVPFWEDEEAYRRNSPVFHIEDMNTPFLMAQGTEDGAVDFNQGVEFYNAARRAGKDFVFLVYNGENHGFRNEANQKDYHRRINEWFGHYLKGDPAPEWITEGMDYLDQQKFARPSLTGGR